MNNRSDRMVAGAAYCKGLQLLAITGLVLLTNSSIRGADWITDPDKLLKHLQSRDQQFEGRTVQVDQRWTEKVHPASQIAAANAAAQRFGQAPSEPPKSIPDPFEQPHRRRYSLTVRGDEITIESGGELEEMKHRRYVAISNKGMRWTNVGGEERSYSPETKSLTLSGKYKPHTQLASHRWMFQRCCGYGVAQHMKSIESVEIVGDLLRIKGPAQFMDYDDSRVDMQCDADYIIRTAEIYVPVQIGTGGNRYVIETEGTVRPEDSPAVAKTGNHRRILMPLGKPERLYKQYDVDFVSISGKLTDEQYAEQTKLDPPEDARIVDFRPLAERKKLKAKK